ncbi:MAG: response regulator [Agathobacter sp.]|nr:response regulator [Agathobacter sp.]
MAHNILVFSEERSFLYIAMEEQLKGLGYNVINVGTNVNEINAVKEDITALLMYTDEDMIKKQQALVFMRDKAVEEDMPVFAIGDVNELAEIRNLVPKQLLKKEFQRPIDVKEVVASLDEYIKNNGKHTKKKILVVDDSGVMLRNVKGWLEDYYQVSLANSGTMAIKYLSTNRPDLVLLDYEMPVINGKQVLEMIRSESEFSSIPVMFLTSKNDKETITQVLGLKPEGYILKSTKPEQIIQMINEFFQKQKTI